MSATWIKILIYMVIIQNCTCNKIYEIWSSKTFLDTPKTINIEGMSDVNNSLKNDVIQHRRKSLLEDIMDNVKTTWIKLLYKKPSIYVSTIERGNEIVFNNRIDSSYIPDMYLSTPQFIVKYGYKAESHTVKTEDGYLLTMHRIPCNVTKSKCQPVFLQHGLLASSSDFVITGPKKALAFILADAGYDVWLGNFRGNTYSRAHINKSIEDASFWDFSWHECAMYDLPAMIDYVNEYKGNKFEMIYIGHSMGTTTMFALLSTKTEYNKKLKMAFTLAPVAYMKSLKSPIKYLSAFVNSIDWIREHLGLNEFLPQNAIMKWLAADCELNKIDQRLCENILFVICGYDQLQLDDEILPVILGHTPAGASTKTIIHFAQEIGNHGNFQQYDYGAVQNKKKYGQSTPPLYPLSNITLPMGFFCAENDWLSAMSDAKNLYKQLQNPIEFYKVPYKQFNHLDFLWAKDAPALVYSKLLELIRQLN